MSSGKYQPENCPVREFLGPLKMFIFVFLKWVSLKNILLYFVSLHKKLEKKASNNSFPTNLRQFLEKKLHST